VPLDVAGACLMAELWMPGATRLDVGDHAATDGGPAKAVAHITWDKNATAAKPIDLVPYTALRSYFAGGGAGVAPHILWDPFEGHFTQFVPANSRSKSLVDAAGGTRTNRAGSVVIQVEALFFPYCRVGTKIYPRLVDTPCKGWADLQAWVHSWGVPNSWPMGKPVDFTSHRNESTWEKTAGWYGHSQIPENTHQDPGSWPAFVGTTTATPSVYEPFPGASLFKAGKKSPIIAAMHKRLVAEGCGRYKSSANPDTWGSGDAASYAAWQRKLGYTGTAADGIPGSASWSKLHVPNV
jgi:hypothetical protein